jgi:hypothetical protein
MPLGATPMKPPNYRILLRDCAVDRAFVWVEDVLQAPTQRTAAEGRTVIHGCKGEADVAWREEEPRGTDVHLFLTYSPWQSNAHCARAANHALGCVVACDGPDEDLC